MDFDTAFERVFTNEGLFQNDPKDRGNWTSGKIGVGDLKGTKFGISAMTYPTLDIENLTVEKAKEIYLWDWWYEMGMHRFPNALHYQLFDAALNHGMYATCKLLQKSVSVHVDGIIGPQTLKAIDKTDINDILLGFLAERLLLMTSISTWEHYGKGWAVRIAHNLKLATIDNDEV